MNPKKQPKRINWFKVNGIILILACCVNYYYHRNPVPTEMQIRQNREAAERKQFQLELERRIKAAQQESENPVVLKHHPGQTLPKSRMRPRDNTAVFDDSLGDFLEDPEDDLSYPSEIFEDQIDENEEDLIENRVYD